HGLSPETNPGLRYSLRHVHRSNVRAEGWTRHSASLHPTLHRSNGCLWALRIQVQLRLYGHDQLVFPDDTASDAVQSKGSIRRTVWFGWIAGRASPPREIKPEHPRRHHARRVASSERSRRTRSSAAFKLS